MAVAELGLALWLGQDIPLGDQAWQPALAWGGRARYRPSASVGAEVGLASGDRGAELVLDGLAFVGEPTANLVVVPLFGLGLRGQTTPALLVESGLTFDVVLAEVLDVRPDARLVWTDRDGVALRLGVGLAVHVPRRFDRDGDGVSDQVDRCPDQAEDLDGALDADGCPDPDNDGDRVLDAADACPGTPEDRDGFLDADGCPEPDNDGDGLHDERDACINEREDDDGFRDLDGCPDPDNDDDGVADTVDGCRNVPEDRDAFQDADGCPDPDNDGDGVGDRFDLAPDAPENINFFEDDDGVPEELPPVLRRAVGLQPRLKFRGVELTEAGAERAELLAAALAEYPTVRVRVVVSDPDPVRAERRAVSVAAAVVAGGTLAERVEPAGLEGEVGVVVELIP